MTPREIVHDLLLLERKLLTYNMVKRQKETAFIKLNMNYDNLYHYHSDNWYCQRVGKLRKMIEVAILEEITEKSSYY